MFKSENAFNNVVDKIIDAYAQKKQSNDIHSNVIDPFSALIESSIQGVSYEEWLIAEDVRQIQKTLQNKIGDLHQGLIGALVDFEDLHTGSVVDAISHDQKIIAEVKNKFNTTKGNHKKEIYDDLASLLSLPEYSGYTGYYIEVIPKNSQSYDKVFTPPDNVTRKNRPSRTDIRVIDGATFYEKVTGEPNALEKIYDKICLRLQSKGYTVYKEFKSLFYAAY